VAQTRYSRATPGERLEEMVYHAASAALADARITRDEVDNIVIAASDAVDGRAISSMLTACPAGAYLKDEIKASDEGGFAVILAALRLLTGEFETSLVVSWSKPSECTYSAAQSLVSDPFFTRPFGLNHVTSTALLAARYRSRYGISDDAPARVVAKNRENGRRNPLLEAPAAVTVDQVRASRYVAYPIRELEIAPEADGAAAVVLTARENLGSRKHPRPRLAGMGWATDQFELGERDLTRFSALEIATKQAYQTAGITDPLKQLDVAELCDASAYHELLACEALGFCGAGEASKLLKSGATATGGDLPVNPSGGCLSAYPVFSAGLTRFVECCLQVSGRAEQRQVAGAQTALAHGCTGYAGQSHCVMIVQAT
jgi:acetyl-CoA C-acetyltransferase